MKNPAAPAGTPNSYSDSGSAHCHGGGGNDDSRDGHSHN